MTKQSRLKKHQQSRRKIIGTSNQPRLSVFRSTQHIYCQIIDDGSGKTILSASDLNMGHNDKQQRAYEVGKQLAAKAHKQKITEVVFDRGGFLYHGRVAELARGAREGGLKF